MSEAALVLVLAAAVLHATWNRVLHGAEDRLAAARTRTSAASLTVT